MCSSFFDDLWDARGCNFFAENPKEAKKKEGKKRFGSNGEERWVQPVREARGRRAGATCEVIAEASPAMQNFFAGKGNAKMRCADVFSLRRALVQWEE